VPFPTTERFVARAETELQCRLPLDYRTWVLANNGGELSAADDDWQVFPVFDDSDRKKAARSASHIVRETGRARKWPGFPFPAKSVAFAENGSGDLLVFLPRASDPGELAPEVYVWSHETGTCACIASSLSDLIETT
jgi:hypothetical protein